MQTQQAHWDSLVKEAALVKDKLGKGLDEGIVETVVALWGHGLETRGSCEGHLGRDCPNPWVDITAGKKTLPKPPCRPLGFYDISPLLPRLQLVWEKSTDIPWPEQGWAHTLSYLTKNSNDTLQSFWESEDWLMYEQQKKDVWHPIAERVWGLLNQFYAEHEQPEQRLRLHILLPLGRIEPAGAYAMGWMLEDEKERFLADSQAEMAAFTAFLKRLFFKK